MIKMEPNKSEAFSLIEQDRRNCLENSTQRNKLERKSVHRNPLIADLFHRMGEVEKVGSGIKRMREAAKAAGVPAPQFEATGFFTITYRKPAKAKELESQPGKGVRLS